MRFHVAVALSFVSLFVVACAAETTPEPQPEPDPVAASTDKPGTTEQKSEGQKPEETTLPGEGVHPLMRLTCPVWCQNEFGACPPLC
jgi:hypothetical protein